MTENCCCGPSYASSLDGNFESPDPVARLLQRNGHIGDLSLRPRLTNLISAMTPTMFQSLQVLLTLTATTIRVSPTRWAGQEDFPDSSLGSRARSCHSRAGRR